MTNDTGGAALRLVHYRGRFRCDQAGRHGYAVRVVPAHRDLVIPVEMGCVTWA